jgi:hypothetical protein
MYARFAFVPVVLFGLSTSFLVGEEQQVRSIKPGDKAEILFAAQSPPSDKDEKGKPSLTTLEPIAFLVGGELRGCYASNSEVEQAAVDADIRRRLERAYSAGRHYPLWWGGTRWGEATAIRSSIDPAVNSLSGCFQIHSEDPSSRVAKNLKGIVITGTAPAATHTAVRAKADSQERSAFLQAVAMEFTAHHVRFVASKVVIDDVWKTQLRADHTALAGSALLQVPAGKPLDYRSYRLFLVIEEDGGTYRPVLRSLSHSDITLGEGQKPPKPGEELDEGDSRDKELFFDNFPLFAGEPDAVLTSHYYYESWSFSVYRWTGNSYKRIYTGCGGGI